MVHLLTYELSVARMPAELTRLEAAIKELGTCFAFHRTAWIVQSELSNQQICERLKPFFRPNDRVMATRVHADWCAFNITEAEVEWLNGRNFSSSIYDETVVHRVPLARRCT